MLVEMEVLPISRMRALFSNHNPSQTTLGNIYIAGRKKITMASIRGHQKCAVECAIRLQSTGQLQNDAGGSKSPIHSQRFFLRRLRPRRLTSSVANATKTIRPISE
ncbi:hypothetical protein AAG612_12425 [Citromicrobium bathyomarinum]|uniref:hypothetical protein n=1 Tax=Citromicrobium bathyomarinum TaxID=72174 RepID=UPI003159E147